MTYRSDPGHAHGDSPPAEAVAAMREAVQADDLDDFMEEDMDEMDEAIQNCGYSRFPDGTSGCLEAGTEYCDWECPFRASYERSLQPRDARGRFRSLGEPSGQPETGIVLEIEEAKDA